MVFDGPLRSLLNVNQGDQSVLLDANDVSRGLAQVLFGRAPCRGIDGFDHEGKVGVVTPQMPGLCET